jgi:hypothetical protein
MSRLMLGLTGLLLVFAHVSCQTASDAYDSVTGHKTFKPVSAEELSTQITAFVNTFTQVVERTALEIEQQHPGDVDLRRQSLRWRIRGTQEMQTLLGEPDARRALADLWVWLIQAHNYQQTDPGKKVYGESLEQIEQATGELIKGVEKIAATVIAPEEMDATRKALKAYAAQNPMTNLTLTSPVGALGKRRASGSALGSIVDIPLAPFHAFEGVSEGAASIREFAIIANRFAAIVQGMPQQVAWQTEFILLELNQAPAFASALESMDRASKAAAELTKTAAALPTELGKETRATIDELADRQGDLVAMLESAKTVATQMQATATSLTEALHAVDKTSNVINRVFIEGDPNAPPPSPDDPPTRPFNITEYTATADAVTRMAAELQKTVNSVDALLKDAGKQGSGLEQLTAATVSQLKWSLIQVVGVAFVAALIYRLLTRKITPRRSAEP